MNAFIKLLYAILIAVTVVVFTGVAVYSLYPSPKAPEYPSYSYTGAEPDPEIQNKQQDFDKQLKAYQDKEKSYQKNVTMILLPLAVVIVGAGLFLIKRSDVIGEGLALGGIATSIYATISASIADARLLRLLAVTLLLVSTLLLANRKFMAPNISKRPATKKSWAFGIWDKCGCHGRLLDFWQ